MDAYVTNIRDLNYGLRCLAVKCKSDHVTHTHAVVKVIQKYTQ